MSTQRGNASRTRSQKYKNRTAFKNDLHDKTPQQKRVNSLHVSEVCQHCKNVIEWKIKYKKYKPLTQPKVCTKCQQRNIRKAYHVLCRDCSLAARVCAKCLKSSDEVEIELPQPTSEEELKLKIEMERLIKTFSERKRRAFLRYMNKGKKIEENDNLEKCEHQVELTANKNFEKGQISDNLNKIVKRIPYTRDELLERFEQLKLTTESDDDDNDYIYNSDTDSSSSIDDILKVICS